MIITSMVIPGMTVYSAVHGKRLRVEEVRPTHINPIMTTDPETKNLYYFTKTGSYVEDGECVLFPSKTCRNWQEFCKENYYINEGAISNYVTNVSIENIKIKYPTNTLEPFTPVLVRNSDNLPWKMNFFSHMNGDKYVVMCGIEYKYCIPYNINNKHLLNHETN